MLLSVAIPANPKRSSARRNPSDYVILSEAKNLSSSLETKPPESVRDVSLRSTWQRIGFGSGALRAGYV